MIKLIIWSKDRASQLHFLLESIEKHAPYIFDSHVVYTFSSTKYGEGYDLLKSRFPNTLFHKETTIAETTRNLVNETTNSMICFATDDCVVFRDITETPVYLKPGQCFSFRYGLNTILQNYFDGSLQPPLNRYSTIDKDKKIIAWNALDYHPLMNYGYNMALDFHAYNTSQFKEILARIQFKNTNQLEGNMTQYRQEVPYMMSYTASKVVNIPLNNMSSLTEAQTDKLYEQDSLNEKYLNGQILSFNNFDATRVIGAHQVFEFKLVNYNG